ncbi:hypothetical protein EV421DRAFT_2039002 [Armillaria borealis]|uniref:F-box domain-containing protein n=1 Tax=Armillaria borealis TaxID=47425 RepID=A0AA39J412_9AGAR|nr:hypothetical protein EV421DRAFT_2039002 [Armillaria borealis]
MASNLIVSRRTTCPTCGSLNTPTWPARPAVKLPVPYPCSPRVSELLRSNEIPSEAELSEFQDAANRGRRRMADIDEKIEGARELIDKLERERCSLTAEIEDMKIVSSPVRRLPPDVLRSICLETIPSSSDIMSPTFRFCDSLDTRSSPWTISHVCSRWRSTVVSAPELWSSTSLVIGDTRSAESNFWNIFLFGIRIKRSESRPLTVSLRSASDVSQHPLLALIPVHASALKNLRIHVPVISLGAFSRCRGLLDCLDHLILESNEVGVPAGWTNSTFGYASKLRTFTAPIHNLPRGVEIPWFQLSHCGLQIDNEQDLSLLERLDNVESADIRSSGTLLRVPQGHTPIHLPRLTSLALTSQNPMFTPSPDIRVIFSSLSLPNLVDLHITYSAVPVLPHISIHPNVITRLELTRLSSASKINEKYTFPGLSNLLNAVTNLRCLALNSAKALSSDDISQLRGISLPSYIPLPHLRVLDLSGCKFEYDHSNIVEMVKTRRNENDPDCDQLEILYLASPLKLDGQAADIWQNLIDEGLNVVYGAHNVASR